MQLKIKELLKLSFAYEVFDKWLIIKIVKARLRRESAKFIGRRYFFN